MNGVLTALPALVYKDVDRAARWRNLV